jgi:hypothetical protein
VPEIIRQYNPNVKSKRIGIEIPEPFCPGLLEFFAHLPYGLETPLIRGIVYQWFLAHRDYGQLEEAVRAILEGPGGSSKRTPEVPEMTALKTFIQAQRKKPAKRRTTKSLDK